MNKKVETSAIDNKGCVSRTTSCSNGVFSCHIMENDLGELWIAATEVAEHFSYCSPRSAVRKYTRPVDRQVVNIKTPTGWRKMNYISVTGFALLSYFQKNKGLLHRKYSLWMDSVIASINIEFCEHLGLDEDSPTTYKILNEIRRQNGMMLLKAIFCDDLESPLVEYVEDQGLPLCTYIEITENIK